MRSYTLIITILTLLSHPAAAQQQHSVHREHMLHYKAFDFNSESEWNQLHDLETGNKPVYTVNSKGLNQITYGWYPYWMGTAYYDFDYSLLSDVAYFSYEVNADTGEPNSIHYWMTTNIVNEAHAAGSRIHLCATLFSDHAAFFSNPDAVNAFIDSIVSLVEYRDADGVNIDFEMVPSSQKEDLTAMMQSLSQELKAANPEAQLSIALPAVDWGNTFDVAAMTAFTDLFIIMGYEYHWSGSAYAGPGAPKNSGSIWSEIDLTRSVNDYLEKGVPPEQLVLAVPYYGRDWPVSAQTVPAPTAGSGGSRTYSQIQSNYSAYQKQWDDHSSVSYYAYNNGSEERQCWFNDTSSLALIYDMVKMKELAGIGIWALGYDGDQPELWALLDEKFGNEANIRPSGTFSDMGGPHGDYFDDEDYFFTINPPAGDTLYLLFEYAEIEADYDTLFIYDSIADPDHLIAEITGFNTPDLIKIPSRKAVFRFYSDGATTEAGWLMHWNTDSHPLSTEGKQAVYKDIKVYPNPFGNHFIVEIESKRNQTVTVQLNSINGRTVYQNEMPLKTGMNHFDFNFLSPSLPDGYYVLSFISEGKRIEYRNVKVCKNTRF